MKQRTIIEFGGGPVLVITREAGMSDTKPVQYGRLSPSTNSYVLPVLNTVERCVNWYELQAVLCWNGQVSTRGEAAGHYICFVYEDFSHTWYFYNDMNRRNGVEQAFSGLQKVPFLEEHSQYPPSETGTMFIYVKLAAPPNDVQ